jgi:hypothetical protein
MNRTGRIFFISLSATLGLTLPLAANPILPGGNVVPDAFSLSSPPSLLNEVSGTFDFGGTFAGSYEEVVMVDPFGITCTGCLDFAFQIGLNANSNFLLNSLALQEFFGYTTDVGYVVGSGDLDPSHVTRGPAGGQVVFDYSSGDYQAPGEYSDYLVIATNATTYDSNGALDVTALLGQSDPGGQISGVFEPTLMAPEPSTVLLFGLGLVGIVAFRKRTS